LAKGVNVTVIKQLSPAGTVLPQVLVSAKSLAIRSNDRNPREVHRHTALVAEGDPLRKTLGPDWLIAEVQACG
jgi:hypothetical protein